MNKFLAVAATGILLVSGCAGYRWTSSVPESYRTVTVPVFANRTQAPELGAIFAQYALREFQREGTFGIRSAEDEPAVEIQGTITSAEFGAIAFERGHGLQASEYRYSVAAEVSVIDRVRGKVVLNNRRYVAETTFLVQRGDVLTGQRNAASRVAADMARQIVDDVIAYPWPDAAAGGVGK